LRNDSPFACPSMTLDSPSVLPTFSGMPHRPPFLPILRPSWHFFFGPPLLRGSQVYFTSSPSCFDEGRALDGKFDHALSGLSLPPSIGVRFADAHFLIKFFFVLQMRSTQILPSSRGPFAATASLPIFVSAGLFQPGGSLIVFDHDSGDSDCLTVVISSSFFFYSLPPIIGRSRRARESKRTLFRLHIVRPPFFRRSFIPRSNSPFPSLVVTICTSCNFSSSFLLLRCFLFFFIVGYFFLPRGSPSTSSRFLFRPMKRNLSAFPQKWLENYLPFLLRVLLVAFLCLTNL